MPDDFGRETIQLFEIFQPQCALEYGVAPCMAVLGTTGERKCFNTLGTCQDPENYTTTPTVASLGGSADFDGTDSMSHAGNLTGAADSKQAIFSAWIRLDGGDGVNQMLVWGNDAGNVAGFYAQKRDAAQGNIFGAGNINGSIIVESNAPILAGPAWRHILISWDGETGARHFYLDDADVLGAGSVAGDNAIPYSGVLDWFVGVDSPDDGGTLFFNGCVAELYFAPGQYLDFSVRANRRKFISATGKPVDLGSDGSEPTGVAPIMYHRIDPGAAASTFATNRGTGGAFTTSGALIAGSSVPYDSTPKTLTLRFAREQEGLLQYGPLIPSLQDVSTTPASINLGSMDDSASALGQREVISVKCDDSLHNDLLVDPYRLERIDGTAQDDAVGYDPYTLGTYWGKWLARNPYYTGFLCAVREGYLGDEIEDLRARYYVIDTIAGPTNGAVTIKAKDLFSLIEERKAVAPVASRGELSADISAVAGSATLFPVGIGALDYPASGFAVIGDEEVAFTRAGDVLTLTQRGANNTQPDAHDEEDLVQLVLVYATELPHDVVYDLLVNYSAVAAASIDKAQWDIDAAEIVELYSTHITKPTPVAELIGELAQQAGFTVWPEVETNSIRFAPLRSQAPTATVDDDAWIVERSLTLQRDEAKRVSQVWVYYGRINPVEDLDERRNYHSRVVTLPASNPYGTEGIKEIFSRWIPQFGRQAAERIGERLLGMFRDAPIEAKFALHASRDGELALARYFTLSTFDVQDDTGAMLDTVHAAIEIERGENEIQIRGQQVKFFTSEGDTGERVIYIENDFDNANLRAIHDSLYAAPVSGVVVRFIVLPGVVVGSASTSLFAVDTGDWPAGVVLQLQIDGRVAGAGGLGGVGGQSYVAYVTAGTAGQNGGVGLKARFAITLIGGGILAGGGGGGGGGGAAKAFFNNLRTSGGGGGGGAGRIVGSGGSGGSSDSGNPGGVGSNGTLTAGGLRGAGAVISGAAAGNGGDGGDPGENGAAGSAGVAADGAGDEYGTAGGAAGAAGAAINGVGFVTLSWSGTIIGATV